MITLHDLLHVAQTLSLEDIEAMKDLPLTIPSAQVFGSLR